MTYRDNDCCGDTCRVTTVMIPGPQGGKGDKGDAPADAVLYTPQAPSAEEQAQARKNLGLQAWDAAPDFSDIYRKAKEGESNG
nr:MAG TPA: hypothetical protein [Caudoviricetes sp.]